MSTLRNVESVMNPKQNQQNQQGFKPSVQRDGPITEGGVRPIFFRFFKLGLSALISYLASTRPQGRPSR